MAFAKIDQNKNLLDEIQKASIDTTKLKQEYTKEQPSIYSPKTGSLLDISFPQPLMEQPVIASIDLGTTYNTMNKKLQ